MQSKPNCSLTAWLIHSSCHWCMTEPNCSLTAWLIILSCYWCMTHSISTEPNRSLTTWLIHLCCYWCMTHPIAIVLLLNLTVIWLHGWSLCAAIDAWLIQLQLSCYWAKKVSLTVLWLQQLSCTHARRNQTVLWLMHAWTLLFSNCMTHPFLP